MSQEIELKFQIDDTSIKSLCCFLQTRHCVKQQSLHLTNTYYDSGDSLLRNHRSSLRIRGTGQLGLPTEYEITVKSSGKAVAGLHARQEYNVPLPNSQLDLSVLPEQIFAGLDKTLLSKSLIAQFTTDFERQMWLINYNQSQIEVALDQGLISAQNSMLPILEVELELKQGEQNDLLLFALELSQFNIHLYSQSKAARGYALLQGHHLTKVPLNRLEGNTLSDVLQYWQANEEYALAFDDVLFYQKILDSVTDALEQVSLSVENVYSTQLNQVYQGWLRAVALITDVKSFAFSAVNTQLKLYLLLISK